MENFDKFRKGQMEDYQIDKLCEYFRIGLNMGIDEIKTILKSLETIEINFERYKYNYFKFMFKLPRKLAKFLLD